MSQKAQLVAVHVQAVVSKSPGNSESFGAKASKYPFIVWRHSHGN